jgi:hypothetical protein
MYFGLKGQSVPLLFYCLLPAQKLPSYLLPLVSFMEAGRLSLRAERRVTRSNWTDLLWSNFSGPPPPIGSSLPVSGSFCPLVHPMIIRAAYLTSKGPASRQYAAKHPTLLWLLILRQPMWRTIPGWNPFSVILFIIIIIFFWSSSLWLCFELQVGLQMLGSAKPHIISILMLSSLWYSSAEKLCTSMVTALHLFSISAVCPIYLQLDRAGLSNCRPPSIPGCPDWFLFDTQPYRTIPGYLTHAFFTRSIHDNPTHPYRPQAEVQAQPTLAILKHFVLSR